MRSICVTLFVCLLTASMLSTSQAAVHDPLIPGINNRIDFNNWEYVVGYSAGSTSANLAIGDTIRGVIQAQNIGDGPSGGVVKSLLSTGGSLLGIFEFQVYAINNIGGVASELVLGPSASGWQSALGISADAVFAFYHNPALDPLTFDPSLGTDALVQAQITGGAQLLASAGFLRNAGGNLDLADYSLGYIVAGADFPAQTIPVAGSLQFSWGLSLLDGPLVTDPLIIINQQTNPYNPFVLLPVTSVVYNNGYAYDFVGRGQVNPLPTGHYTIFSQDPALLDFDVVPEPASVVVWSLIGLGAVGCVRRRRSKV